MSSDTVRALLERYPRSGAEEIGVHDLDAPSGLFRLLGLALLSSARIRASVAVDAANALADAGWTTAEKMARSSWEDRARVLNEAGYARYDERTSTMLGRTAEAVVERYRGDLRRLREEAGRDPRQERRRLRQFPGIGEVGADIFSREVQGVWDELRPFVDDRSREAASRLGLPDDPGELAALVPHADLPRLLHALVRAHLDDAVHDLRPNN